MVVTASIQASARHRLFSVRTSWTWDQNVPLWEKFVRKLKQKPIQCLPAWAVSPCLGSGVLANQRKHFLLPRVTSRLNLGQILKTVQSLSEPCRCPQYLFSPFSFLTAPSNYSWAHGYLKIKAIFSNLSCILEWLSDSVLVKGLWCEQLLNSALRERACSVSYSSPTQHKFPVLEWGRSRHGGEPPSAADRQHSGGWWSDIKEGCRVSTFVETPQ